MKQLFPILFLACCSIATAQDTIRVCTYNVLNYSQSNEDGRSERFERILREIKPDILIAQEIGDETGATKLISAYYNAFGGSVGLSAPGFNDGNDTDNMIYFHTSKFNNLGAKYHKTTLRDIAEYKIVNINTGDTLHIFSVHLKAGDTKEDKDQRVQEIYTLNSVSPFFNTSKNGVMWVGDFNFYSPEEQGYELITHPLMMGYIDPIRLWERNSADYLEFYTQSPRMVADAGCGGGTGGGMDDRFDFIFYSQSLKDNFVPGSYTVFGNDGIDRRSSPINNPPNTKVSAQIADDLACASDHLPVYADFVFGKPTSIETPGFVHEITFSETAEYVNVFLPSSGNITVTNLLGQTIHVLNEDGGHQHIIKAGFTPGVYFIQVTSKADAGSIAGWYKFVITQ